MRINEIMASAGNAQWPMRHLPLYHRFTNGGPDLGSGYMMFALNVEDVRHYGRNHYIFSPTDLPAGAVVDAESDEFQQAVVAVLAEHQDLLDEYQATPERLAAEAAPDDIVTTAGLWDAPALVEVVWEGVLEPHGWLAVLTPDGAVVFDPSVVRNAQSEP